MAVNYPVTSTNRYLHAVNIYLTAPPTGTEGEDILSQTERAQRDSENHTRISRVDTFI